MLCLPLIPSSLSSYLQPSCGKSKYDNNNHNNNNGIDDDKYIVNII